jgi:hypothetical protein
VPATLESHGEIEVICDTSNLEPNRIAKLVFRAYVGSTPPYQISVTSPSGAQIVKRVIRVLPTGQPQSPSPITFTVQTGDYVIEIRELEGDAEGRATLSIR